MPYYIVEGVREGIQYPLYLAADHEQGALERARKLGMRPSNVRLAKEPNSWIPWILIGFELLGLISIFVFWNSSVWQTPVLFAFMAIMKATDHIAYLQRKMSDLQQEVAELRSLAVANGTQDLGRFASTLPSSQN